MHTVRIADHRVFPVGTLRPSRGTPARAERTASGPCAMRREYSPAFKGRDFPRREERIVPEGRLRFPHTYADHPTRSRRRSVAPTGLGVGFVVCPPAMNRRAIFMGRDSSETRDGELPVGNLCPSHGAPARAERTSSGPCAMRKHREFSPAFKGRDFPRRQERIVPEGRLRFPNTYADHPTRSRRRSVAPTGLGVGFVVCPPAMNRRAFLSGQRGHPNTVTRRAPVGNRYHTLVLPENQFRP
jgi:hypothetical protein